jgi:hypothetical protein
MSTTLLALKRLGLVRRVDNYLVLASPFGVHIHTTSAMSNTRTARSTSNTARSTALIANTDSTRAETYNEARDPEFKHLCNRAFARAVAEWFDVKQTYVFVLDAAQGLTLQALLKVGVPSSRLFVANYVPAVCTALRNLHLIPAKNILERDAIRYLRDETKMSFNCAYLDLCGQPDLANRCLDALLCENVLDRMVVGLTFTQARLSCDHLDFGKKMAQASSAMSTLAAACCAFSATAHSHDYTMKVQYHAVSGSMHFLLVWLQRSHAHE